MSIATPVERLENGLRQSKFAEWIASIYGSLMEKTAGLEERPSDPGFAAVANEALAIYAGSLEAQKDFKVVELAQRLRQAYALPMQLEMSQWESTPYETRCAWEAVARFCAFAPQADTADDASNSASEFFMLANQKIARGQNGS